MPSPRGHLQAFCSQRAHREPVGGDTRGPYSQMTPGPGLSAHPGGAGTEPSDKAPQKPEPPPAGRRSVHLALRYGNVSGALAPAPLLLPTEPPLLTVCATDPPSGQRDAAPTRCTAPGRAG